MSDYDNWKNGVTDLFGKRLEDNDPGATREEIARANEALQAQRDEEEHEDLAMQLFGKKQEELDDDEYREYMAQLALLDEDVLS